MTNYNKVIDPIINGFLGAKVVRATMYISPKLIVRATRKLAAKRIMRGNVEMIVTVGRPNYLECDFIRKCKKAGEPFPVKKIQVKLYRPPRVK